MKNIFLSLCFLWSISTLAQSKGGKVVYERTIQMQNRFQGLNDEMTHQIPQNRTDQFELLFGNNQSLWQRLPDLNEESSTIPGGGMVIRFRMDDEVIYHHFGSGKRLEQREIMDKEYLIEDSIRKLNWKLSTETKTLLNHVARKATAQRIGTRMQMAMENGEMKRQEIADTSYITAWFTTDIPVPAGPGAEFGGQLPGLILELEMNNGSMVYKAIEISPKVKFSDIKEPKRGKKILMNEFTKEREKIFEEMRQNMPNGGRMRIIEQ